MQKTFMIQGGRLMLAIAFSIAVGLLLIQPASASTDKNSSQETMRSLGGMYLHAGNAVILTEPVEQDAFLAGSSIHVQSNVNGDIFAAGQDVTIDGDVTGDIRAAGSMVTLSGVIDGNVQVFGNTVKLNSDAVVRGHLNVYGATVIIDGTVDKTLTVGASTVVLNGAVNSAAKIDAEHVQVGEKSVFAVPAAISALEEPKVAREDQRALIQFTQRDLDAERQEGSAMDRFWQTLSGVLYWYVGLSIVGIVLMLLWGSRVESAIDSLEERPWHAVFVGVIFLLIVPMIAVLLAVTIIGLPLSLFTFGAYIAALAVAQMLVSVWIGRKLLPSQTQEGVRGMIIQFLIGFLIVSLLSATPFMIGFLVKLVVTVLGLGAIVQVFKSHIDLRGHHRAR